MFLFSWRLPPFYSPRFSNPATQAYYFPAWGERRTIAVPLTDRGAHKHLLAWNTPDLTAHVTKLAEDRKPGRKKQQALPDEPTAQWQRDTGTWLAVILAPNAVLAAPGDQTPHKLARNEEAPPSKYRLSALRSDNGELIWEVTLPSEPLFDGLAIASDGSVLVQLLDGRLLCLDNQETVAVD